MLTKIEDVRGTRNKCFLTLRGRLWFTDEPNSMYVYYQPTHWRFA
ncbi:hypothetical protein [Sphingomonas liriopis]|nr:hypothetical protein [Sphingomonas liriopis]